jgi:hypothetical protein
MRFIIYIVCSSDVQDLITSLGEPLAPPHSDSGLLTSPVDAHLDNGLEHVSSCTMSPSFDCALLHMTGSYNTVMKERLTIQPDIVESNPQGVIHLECNLVLCQSNRLFAPFDGRFFTDGGYRTAGDRAL